MSDNLYCIKFNRNNDGLREDEYWVKLHANPNLEPIFNNIGGDGHILHRENDLPAVYSRFGKTKETVENYQWRRNGWYWRETGPSDIEIITDDKGTSEKRTYINRRYLHRLDGPAIETKGVKRSFYVKKDWYLYGNKIDHREYKRWAKENGIRLDNITENDKIVINLKWNIKGISLDAPV